MAQGTQTAHISTSIAS